MEIFQLELKQKLYQMFILAPEVDILNDSLAKALQFGLGGVIFFTHNIFSSEQLKSLVDEIKQQSIIPPFLSIDQEGGRVERTQNIYGGKKYQSAQFALEKGATFLQEQTYHICDELKTYGLNMNFAPVLDVNTVLNNPIISERAYSSKTDEVIAAAKIVLNVYDNMKIVPVMKHFPGHGMTTLDSHISMPVCDLGLSELESIHIKPFKFALSQNAPAIMVSHVYYKCFDEAPTPASLSRSVIDEYLRKKLGFGGIVISDDMVMGAVGELPKIESLVQGIEAGLDMFIYRDSKPETLELIELLYDEVQKDKQLQNAVEKSFARIVGVKQRYGC